MLNHRFLGLQIHGPEHEIAIIGLEKSERTSLSKAVLIAHLSWHC
jgi:hypothetical protein